MYYLYRRFSLWIPFLYLTLISPELYSQSDSINMVPLVQDSVKIPYRYISRKDTLFTGTDTVVIARDLIIREKFINTTILHKVVEGNDTLFLPSDTTLLIMDTLVARVDTIRTRNEKILHSVEQFTKKRNIFSRLLRNIVVFEKKRPLEISSTTAATQTEDKPYRNYNGKIIRDIEVRVLDAFGRSLNDPEKKPRSLLEKGGNVVHIKSQRWVIRNKLLFSRGERLDALKISESERLLREANFIYDARITVKDIPGKDSVDILVIAQDVFSISAGAAYDAANHSPDISLKDVNFLGFGQQVAGSLKLDSRLPKGYNYSWNYTLNNIYRTLTTVSVYNTFQRGQTLTGAGLNRDFISPAIKWAGGLNISFNKLLLQNQVNDTTIITEPLNYNQQDIWIGYAVPLFNQNEDRFKGNRLITSARLIHTDYLKKPQISDSSTYRYFNSSFYLASVGFVNRRYYKDNYIFRFGRTEDIPAGSLLAFTAGIENREVGQRPFFGVTAAWSRYSNKYGYFYTGAGAGGFYQNGWKQAVVYNRTIYFTPLLELGNWGWRNFIGVRYTHGYSQLPGNEININKASGIRGINLPLGGNQKIVMNYETNLFPPVNLIGFRMAFVVFTDLAWISNGGKLIDKSNFYPGYGLGLRFRNDHLIFNTIQILFGYYPNVSRFGRSPYQFFEAQKTFYNFNDFQLSRPDVTPYF
jgi:hypothetical protein